MNQTELKTIVEVVKPTDRKEGYPLETPWLLRKFLEIIPGLFTWTMILSPLIVTVAGITQVLVFYVAFLTVFWGYRGIRFLVGLIVGYKRMQQDLATNFIGKIKNEFPKEYENIKYLYVCPVVKESMDTLDPTFESYANSDIDTKKISVVLAMEEKFADVQLKNFEIIKKKYGDSFREIMYFVHPGNIEGEVKGVKGANINWATRHFVDLVRKRGENIHDYLLITCDSDQRVHPKYLSAITYKYFSVPNREQRFFSSALHTFNNNIWRVPSIIRIQSITLTLVCVQTWVVKKKNKDAFSSYIVNLETVDRLQYWDPTVGIDDTLFYWNGIVRFNGDFHGEEVYIPTYNDAVENESYVKSHISYYKQQHRWGWGIISFPTTIAALVFNKLIPSYKKMEILWNLLETQILYLTVVYLLTFALPILNIISPQYNNFAASYNLPRIMSGILTVLMVLNVPLVYFRRKFTPVPKGWTLWRHAIDFAETALITVNMLTFAFIPFIVAQTELMFGKGLRKNYYATEKVKIKR